MDINTSIKGLMCCNIRRGVYGNGVHGGGVGLQGGNYGGGRGGLRGKGGGVRYNTGLQFLPEGAVKKCRFV